MERLFCVIRVNDCERLAFIWCFIRCTLYFEIPLLWNWSNSYVRNLNVARVGVIKGCWQHMSASLWALPSSIVSSCFYWVLIHENPVFYFSKCIVRVKSGKWVDVQLILLKVESTWTQQTKRVSKRNITYNWWYVSP